jgi:SWI/SNF-related matrix-associated actin-dependent regulator of chromatin subfamily A containing DEAD/H box 1
MDAGKVDKLKELLPAMKARGDRILLFSQFVIMLDVLERVLETMGFNFIRLDGQTPLPERQDLIDEFQSDETITVFLLSTKAGGFGINLTAANVVILYDIDFNPHNDAQVSNGNTG